MLSFSVPTIGVDQLKKAIDENEKNLLVLDARESKEYEISHIPGALYAGYDNFDTNAWSNKSKNTNIVVYCSIGYRSEKVGEKLKKMGFRNVQNLYGSIFEWVNRGYPVYDINGRITTKVHAYNKSWSRWVLNPKMEKIY